MINDPDPPPVVVDIGRMPLCIRTADPAFRAMLLERYAGFVNDAAAQPCGELEARISAPHDSLMADDDISVSFEQGLWQIRRGDFAAVWDAAGKRGTVTQQARNPYSIDSALRVIHSLELARLGGFLLHAASAICGGKAFLFSGLSGAGKTTIARLAPPDAQLLSDEISYVMPSGSVFQAFGTPFYGELARAGANINAPVAALYLLAKGEANRIEPVAKPVALRALLRNTLFFAHDAGMVPLAFRAACDFLAVVPVFRLVFRPDPTVWELIR